MPTIKVAGLTVSLSNIPGTAVTQVQIEGHGVFGFNPANRKFWLWGGSSTTPLATLGLSPFHDKAMRLALIRHSEERARRFEQGFVVQRVIHRRLHIVPAEATTVASPAQSDTEDGHV